MTCSGEGADVVDFGTQLPLKCIDEILSADLAEDEVKTNFSFVILELKYLLTIL